MKKPRPKKPLSGKRLSEGENLLHSLRVHKQVIEASDEGVPLPPGVTHVLVKEEGAPDRLVEKRKSFF